MFQTLILVAALGQADPPRVQPDPPKMGDQNPYEWFRQSILRGERGYLAVGVPDIWGKTYQNHARVESGYLGMKDGLYECYRDRTGKAVMIPFTVPQRMEPVKRLVKQCIGGTCRLIEVND